VTTRDVIVEHRALECRTRGDDHIVDLTADVQAAVASSGVRTGQAALLVQGSTAGLTTLEYEPGLVNHDIAAALDRIAPRDERYEHEETWHDDNGHSHVRASLIGPSLAMPIVGGEIPLGTWQQIVLVDSDTRPRERTVHLSIVGVRSSRDNGSD
jgi:secondary thiamine-phosphate synthase enzyme